jgi:hypothetical protein
VQTAPDSQQSDLCCGFAPSSLPDCEAPTAMGIFTNKNGRIRNGRAGISGQNGNEYIYIHTYIMGINNDTFKQNPWSPV